MPSIVRPLLAAVWLLVGLASSSAALAQAFRDTLYVNSPGNSSVTNTFASGESFVDSYRFAVFGSAPSHRVVVTLFDLAGPGLDLSDLFYDSFTIAEGSGGGGPAIGFEVTGPSASRTWFTPPFGTEYQIDIAGLASGAAGGSYRLDIGVSPVPEPDALALMSLGLLALGWRLRRRG